MYLVCQTKNHTTYSNKTCVVPIELPSITISISRRMIPFPWGSCLGKLERVKANSIEIAKIIDNYHIPPEQP